MSQSARTMVRYFVVLTVAAVCAYGAIMISFGGVSETALIVPQNLSPQPTVIPVIIAINNSNPSQHLKGIQVTFTSFDVFADENPMNISVDFALTNLSDVKSVVIIVYPTLLYDYASINAQNASSVLQFAAEEDQALICNPLEQLNECSTTMVIHAEGEVSFVVLTILNDNQIEVLKGVPSYALSLSPYVEYLQAEADRVATENIVNQASQLQSQVRSTDVMEGLAWIVLGFTIIQVWAATLGKPSSSAFEQIKQQTKP